MGSTIDEQYLGGLLQALASWRFTVARSGSTTKRGSKGTYDTPWLVFDNETPGAWGGGRCVGKFGKKEDAESFASGKRTTFILEARSRVLRPNTEETS